MDDDVVGPATRQTTRGRVGGGGRLVFFSLLLFFFQGTSRLIWMQRLFDKECIG